MSFTYEDFYLSGFNSGSASISGIQRTTPLYWIITGLKYNGNPVTTGDYGWFTGLGIAGSGTLSEQTGYMGFDEEHDEYRGIMTFDVASGLTATGIIELYWNSGISYSQGVTLAKGFDTYSNKNKDVWNILTNTEGSVENADLQHSHSAGANKLSDLDDVARTGAFVYTSGYILMGNDYDSFEVVPFSDVGVFIPLDLSEGATGILEISGSAYIGNINAGKYVKIYMDGDNVRMDAIGVPNILISGIVTGVGDTKIYNAVYN